ncbi:hypothetical protein SAMN05720606_11119 [Paenibacillus polysaccharolyticus]|uniref:Intracellular proteinase inhibitor n=1 Tax=Paenibacillus polysaccharolyticus TaxID=582692 RepID=A0A1G5JGF3_9BACL|nr:hypothetical protein [Paenibacillus polysaccharolyticus]SCY87244.1 hypothetical protein SAMN05720606_11119 [Paenibacillus polysaccharolyticus]
MIKLNIKVLSLILLLILPSCSASNEKDPSDSIFQVGVDEIANIKVNKPFQIVGYLKNSSNRSVEISHGSGMFSYEIYNEDGERILPNGNVLLEHAIGYQVELQPGEEYRNNGQDQRSKEYYEFVIHQPGNYKVKTNVEFMMNNDGKPKKISLSSESKEFKVQ